MRPRNAVEVALPAEGFTEVARLVTGGFLSNLGAGYEVIDNLQLAVELVLRSLPSADGHTRVALENADTELTITLSGFAGEALAERLQLQVHEGLPLSTVLAALADAVETSERPAPEIVLRKRLEAAEG